MRSQLCIALAWLFAAPAARSEPAPPLTFCEGWSVGQRLDYLAKRVNETKEEGKPLVRVVSSLPLQLEVMQRDRTGSRIAWTYGKTAVQESNGGPIEAWALSLYDGLRMDVRTDASGRVKSVANAREVKESMVGVRRRMLAELSTLGVDDEERIEVTRALHLLTEPERSANLALPDAEFVLQLCGRALERGKRQRFDMAPAARGGEPIGFVVSYLLRSVDPDGRQATVEFRTEQSPSVKEFLGALFRLLAEVEGTPQRRLEYRDSGVIEFDLETGWPARMTVERTLRVGKEFEKTRVELALIPPALDPT
jgi:hypothetical protein